MAVKVDDPRVQAAAALMRELSDPVRIAVLQLLAEGDRGTSELAEELGLAGPRLANHLARLREAGLISASRHGRLVRYHLTQPGIATALDAVDALTPTSSPGTRTAPTDSSRLAAARTCYDHLAGRIGVALLDDLVATEALLPASPTEETDIVLGPRAEDGFAALGVDLGSVQPGRRKLAVGCMDWSEQRPHLAGALGAAVLDSILRHGWMRRGQGRALDITSAGRRYLRSASASFHDHRRP